MLHPDELRSLRCTLLSNAAAWATLHPSELGCPLVSCAAICWTTLQLLSYAILNSNQVTVPPIKQFFWMPQCRTDRHSVSMVPEYKKITMPKPFRYRNKETQPVLESSSTGLRWLMPIQKVCYPVFLCSKIGHTRQTKKTKPKNRH